jgi:diguanylate cyclase (GGDEF)-like protein
MRLSIRYTIFCTIIVLPTSAGAPLLGAGVREWVLVIVALGLSLKGLLAEVFSLMDQSNHSNAQIAPKRRLLNIYWLLMFFSLLLLGTFLTFIVWQNLRVAEDDFKQYGHQVHQSLVQNFTVNETILDGFAAFLADVGMQDPNRARFYTRTMIERYSHLYMFQAAQRVRGIDVPAFEQSLKETLSEPLNVRRFEFGSGLVAADVSSKRDYYPLVFVEPTFHDGLNILGLDISSIPFVKQAMDDALSSGLANLSQPIELSDGGEAFVMIKPSFLPGQDVADQYALLVVKTTALLTNLRPKEQGYTVKLAYPDHDPILDLSTPNVEPWQERLFPLLTQYTYIRVGAQDIQLTLTRQLSFAQVNLFLIIIVFLATLAINVLLHLYMRIQFETDVLKQEANRKLYQQANYDHLTGLANRHFFEDHFKRAASRSQRANKSMSLLYIDLNDFKVINDTLGHQMGDHVLSHASSIIRDAIRADDVACRFGGDEFIVLLENIQAAENVDRVVNNLHAMFADVKIPDGQGVKLSASIGSSLYPDDGEDLVALMESADGKMYEQKLLKKEGSLVNNPKAIE